MLTSCAAVNHPLSSGADIRIVMATGEDACFGQSFERLAETQAGNVGSTVGILTAKVGCSKNHLVHDGFL